jgi:hypothetical protein
VQNDRLNARNYLAAARDNLKRNQFGGTLGGPILQGSLFREAINIPTCGTAHPQPPAMFPLWPCLREISLVCFIGMQYQGASYSRLFISNQIPHLRSVRIDILKIILTATDPCGKIQYSMPDNSREHQLLGRIDFERSANHSFSGATNTPTTRIRKLMTVKTGLRSTKRAYTTESIHSRSEINGS